MELSYMDNMQFAQRIKDRCNEKGYTISNVLENCPDN